MAGVKKKRRVEEAWWDRNTASSAPMSTLLSLSHDQQRLHQHTRIVDLTPVPAPEDNDIDDQQTQDSAHYSSDYNYSDFGGDWQGEESGEYVRFWEALNESGVTEDAILQALNRTKQVQAAQVDIKTTRRFNLHSDNPNLAWIPFQEEFLDEMLYTEGRGGCAAICWMCGLNDAVYRCADEECFGGGMMCSGCIVEAHTRCRED
ncbi:hypothetical protein VKT23_014620 [Stygiomarasmius scandens]|uniref:Uncharacterized protein n=1 Tax=Marasmiellus scandens TaxID=2682957 RepID=A0ABR1IZR7_9AGAR